MNRIRRPYPSCTWRTGALEGVTESGARSSSQLHHTISFQDPTKPQGVLPLPKFQKFSSTPPTPPKNIFGTPPALPEIGTFYPPINTRNRRTDCEKQGSRILKIFPVPPHPLPKIFWGPTLPLPDYFLAAGSDRPARKIRGLWEAGMYLTRTLSLHQSWLILSGMWCTPGSLHSER